MMSKQLGLVCLVAMGLAAPLRAEVPQVVTDIAPVQSLVAQVMGDLATPDLLIEAGASPHDFALRPSQAAALSDADLVIWIGAALTPALEGPVAVLGEGAQALSLLDVAGIRRLDYGADGDAHDHDGDGHEDHDDYAHDDHDDHADHADHADDHADAHDHDHSGVDPHAWLDPRNAVIWLGAIAEALGDLDPENADTYRANAMEAAERITALDARIAADLAAAPPAPFMVFHDGYRYFETRFGIAAEGAVRLGDAQAPSARRVAEIRDRIAELGAVCLLAEPQFDTALLDSLTADGGAEGGIIDPLGATLEPGPALYEALIGAMARAFSSCG